LTTHRQHRRQPRHPQKGRFRTGPGQNRRHSGVLRPSRGEPRLIPRPKSSQNPTNTEPKPLFFIGRPKCELGCSVANSPEAISAAAPRSTLRGPAPSRTPRQMRKAPPTSATAAAAKRKIERSSITPAWLLGSQLLGHRLEGWQMFGVFDSHGQPAGVLVIAEREERTALALYCDHFVES